VLPPLTKPSGGFSCAFSHWPAALFRGGVCGAAEGLGAYSTAPVSRRITLPRQTPFDSQRSQSFDEG
jgi:hypothetical protein